MRHRHFILLAASLFLASGVLSREVVKFNTGWKFTKGNPVGAHIVLFDDSQWEDVRLPHDWAITGPFDPEGSADTGKLPWKGEGWYRKTFTLTPEQQDKQIVFVFDGIMAFPEVYINGELAGSWDYGYNSFYFNVTSLIEPKDSNLIAIHVDTRQHDSRWYPGAGIYRKITMVITDDVHIPVWGTYVTTPAVEENWSDVRALTEVANRSDSAETVLLESQVLSPAGHVLAKDTISHMIAAGEVRTFEQWFTLTHPQRWDIDNPVLYGVKSIVRKGGEVCDAYTTPFGIRTFCFTANDGFYLNGRRVQMKGANLHHDHGPLGAKFYRRAEERQIEIMQSLGVNALRNSHNIAAPEFLDLCDSMGILVFNEAFDKWDRKADILPDTDFEEFMDRNLRNFVKRDRNHPSVIIWSVGNEMRDVQSNTDRGLQKLAYAVNVVNRHDPTRPVTIACDQEDGVKWRHFDYYDVHSWNYGHRYLPARHAEPGKAVIISESASTVSTRGFYELPLPDSPTDFTNSGQVSSYDLHAPWWAEIPEEDFYYQEVDEYVAGEFVWTGFDYLGEPTPYNNFWGRRQNIPQERTAKSSYFGIVDLCGIPKDRYYLYKSYWKPEETTVHLLPHWNWENRVGDTIPVFVYTNGDCAELFVNGDSRGTRCKDPKSERLTERYRLMWHDVVYAPGEIKAVAFKEGVEIDMARRTTAGAPARIRLTADREVIRANGEDLVYILAEAVDDSGNPCPRADNLLTFNVKGAGVIEGVGNGNPQSLEPFIANTRELFYGKAMLIVRSDIQPGALTVTVSAAGLEGDTVRIAVR